MSFQGRGVRLAWALVLSGVLTACGGGGGTGGGSVGGGDPPPPPPDPATLLTAKTTFTADDVSHLLDRTRFGPTAADLAAVAKQGVPAFIAAMLVLEKDTPLEMQATTAEVKDTDFPEEQELVRCVHGRAASQGTIRGGSPVEVEPVWCTAADAASDQLPPSSRRRDRAYRLMAAWRTHQADVENQAEKRWWRS